MARRRRQRGGVDNDELSERRHRLGGVGEEAPARRRRSSNKVKLAVSSNSFFLTLGGHLVGSFWF